MNIDTILGRYPLISEQVTKEEVRIILAELQKLITVAVPGAIVEFGCYSGTTSLFIQRYLEAHAPNRTFHVYDSFAGLPPKTDFDASPAGEQFRDGELRASKATFVQNFKKAGLRLPAIHKQWFDQLTGNEIPEPIALAFLDGDYYKSIAVSLQLIEDKLSPGATIIVDDYQSEALPGAARAVDMWRSQHPGWRLRAEASMAILRAPS